MMEAPAANADRTGPGSGRPYAGVSPGERDAQRRARVLGACQELFGTVGYVATTIGRICSTAGVSTRHFYQQYDSKEAAFADLYDVLTRTSFEKVLVSLAESQDRPWDERVPAAFLAYLSPMLHDLRVARIAFVEVMGVSPRLEEIRLEYREQLIATVEAEGARAVAAGAISDRDFRFAALALVGSANAIVYDWAIRADRSSIDDLERRLADLAVSLLTG
jgi:AcrR family transcriptional regulator